MKRSKLYLTVQTLKEERLTATAERSIEIDTQIKMLEPGLTHEEAVHLVRLYESGLTREQAFLLLRKDVSNSICPPSTTGDAVFERKKI